ncbi:MAG TPA: hypothetical protein VF245_10965 [Solirubrobacterales bacterium]
MVFLAIVLAGFGATARALRQRLARDWAGAPALLATVVLTIAVAIVTGEALGVLGLLNAPGLALAATIPAIVLRRRPLPRRTVGGAMTWPAARFDSAFAIGAALLCAVHWAGPVLHSLDVGIYRQDSTWYHLPFAAWLTQTGSSTGLLFTDTLKLAVWFYPLNSELAHALGMVVFGNDLLSPMLNFGWLGVALLAAWCIGRPFGLGAATTFGVALVLDSDMMLVQAGNAPGDVAALACLLAAVALLLVGAQAHRGTEVSGDRLRIDGGPLAIAALAAGLAVGTKMTMLVPVAVLTVGLALAAGRPARKRQVGIWVAGVATTGGFWYLRNLLHSGNPLPWISPGPLPGPSQEPFYPRAAHSIAEYLADQRVWSHFFLPGLSKTLGPLWFAVVLAGLAGLVLGLRRQHGPLIRIIALAGLATLLAHVFNPISASGPQDGPYGFASNLRYAAPGLAIGLILLPLCETRWAARRIVLPAYAGLLVCGAIASDEWVQPDLAAAIAIAALAVFLPAWLLLRDPGRRARVAVLAGVAGVVFVAGYAVQRHYFDGRYLAETAPPLDNPGFRSTPQWSLIQTWAREQRGIKIGIVGTPAAYGQYVFYGADLSNEVRYLGEPGPHGGFTAISSCRRWRQRIDAGRFDAVVITPDDPGSPAPSRQIAWTEASSTSVPAIRANPAAVFLLDGPLDPRQCGEIEATFPFQRPLGTAGCGRAAPAPLAHGAEFHCRSAGR